METLVKLVTKMEASSLLEVTYICTHQAVREQRASLAGRDSLYSERLERMWQVGAQVMSDRHSPTWWKHAWKLHSSARHACRASLGDNEASSQCYSLDDTYKMPQGQWWLLALQTLKVAKGAPIREDTWEGWKEWPLEGVSPFSFVSLGSAQGSPLAGNVRDDESQSHYHEL